MTVVGRVWSVGVVVPARNEQATIVRCLRSVLKACDACSQCGTSWVVLVADGCADQTVNLARRELGSRGEVIECAVGSPGAARRIGAAAVLRAFHAQDPGSIWLANTDADSQVPVDWIGVHLEHASANAGAVAGIVMLDAWNLRRDVQQLYADTYRLSADGTHGHVHGANLGVRGDAYLDVGGWSDVAVSEDHCLWGRLMSRGWRLESPVASVVSTSGRLNGRARGGFADTLSRELGIRERS